MRTRPGTLDQYVVDEQPQYRSLPFAGARVLDLGANIGAFAAYAIGQGAAHVSSFEPEPENFALAVENCAGLPVSLVRAAVVGDERPTVDLFVNPGKNKGAHSLLVSGGRGAGVPVPAVSFADVLASVRPDVIKCDIEGGEYALPWSLPACVRAVAMELHLNRKHWRAVDAPGIVASFAGWTALRPPVIGPKNWTTVAVWRR